jgi:cyclic lactone autoinducer peptide
MKKVLKAVKAVGLKTAKSSVNSASFICIRLKNP